MKAFTRAIDRFCYKHPRFGIPQLIRIIIFGTALVYIFGMMDTTGSFNFFLSFSPGHIVRGEVWRLITFVFIPLEAHPFFLLITLYFTYMLGTYLEQTWGQAKFNIYFFLCVVLLTISGFALYFITLPPASIRAALDIEIWFSAVPIFVSGYYIQTFLILAFATLYPDAEFRLLFLIPIKAKWMGAAIFVLLIYNLYFSNWTLTRIWFPANLIPLVLLIPYLLFCGTALRRLLRLPDRSTDRTRMNFKRATRKMDHDRKIKNYTRKCAVCGKTDTEFPDMEFRYCSRCNGYHCFCLEHINNHVHFQ